MPISNTSYFCFAMALLLIYQGAVIFILYKIKNEELYLPIIFIATIVLLVLMGIYALF